MITTKVGLSGKGSDCLSKWSRFQVLVDAANFLERGSRLGTRQYLKGLVLGKKPGTQWETKKKVNNLGNKFLMCLGDAMNVISDYPTLLQPLFSISLGYGKFDYRSQNELFCITSRE